MIVGGNLFHKINELIPLHRSDQIESESQSERTDSDDQKDRKKTEPTFSQRSLTDSDPDKPDLDDGGLTLITSMTNAQTKETIVCDPKHFKYIELLLADLEEKNLKADGHPVSSQAIDRNFEERDTVKWWWLRRARIQIINGSMYINNNHVGRDDEEGYRTGMILYLRRMHQLYGQHLPDTDFMFVWCSKRSTFHYQFI